jgi:hypothetical protein
MKVTLALLACVASAYAQAAGSAMGAVPTNAGSMASITDMSAPLSTPAALASEEAEASCLTGAYVSSRTDSRCKNADCSRSPYMSCQGRLTSNGVVAACTVGDYKAIESCGCSIASIAVS